MGLDKQKQLLLTLEDLLKLELNKSYLKGVIPKLKGLERFHAEARLRNMEMVLNYEYEQGKKGGTL